MIMYSTYSTNIYIGCNTKIGKAYLTREHVTTQHTYNKVVKTIYNELLFFVVVHVFCSGYNDVYQCASTPIFPLGWAIFYFIFYFIFQGLQNEIKNDSKNDHFLLIFCSHFLSQFQTPLQKISLLSTHVIAQPFNMFPYGTKAKERCHPHTTASLWPQTSLKC